MGAVDIFPPDSWLELINGEILEMAPIGCNHAGHVIRLINIFAPHIGDEAIINSNKILCN